MPRNRFAFAILIGREVQLVCLFEQFLELRDLRLLVGRDDVERLEIVLSVDSKACPSLALVRRRNVGCAARQVSDVAYRRLHDISLTEVSGDGSGFGWGLDNDEFH